MVGGTVAFAFGAGLATFGAPCVFPLLPGYVAYYTNQHGDREVTQPIRQGLTAAAGVLVVFGALTLVVYGFDSHVVSSVSGLEPLAGGVLVALGMVTLAGRAPSIHVQLPRRRNTLSGVFTFGGIYAIAAAGCSLPVLLAVVAEALAMAPPSGAAVLLAYASGVTIPMAGTTVATGYGADILRRGIGESSATLTRIAGGVMLAAGAVQLWAGL